MLKLRPPDYVALFVIIALAAGPYVAFAARLGEWCYPVQIYPDMNLYFLVARFDLWAHDLRTFVDPWYHLQESLAGFSYGTFYLGFFLFGLVAALSKCLMGPLVLWMAMVSAALYLAIRQILSATCPQDRSYTAIVSCLAAAVFVVEPSTAPAMFSGLLKILTLNIKEAGDFGLGFGRFMFPQLPALFLFLNLAMFTQILENVRLARVCVLAAALLQLCALASFPYAVVVIVVAQFVTCLALIAFDRIDRRMVMLLGVYVGLSAFSDGLYIFLMGTPQGTTGQPTFVFDPSYAQLRRVFGGAVILNLAASTACLAAFFHLRRKHRETRHVFLVLSGLAFSVGLLMLSDAAVAAIGTATHHFSYFSSCAAMVALSAAALAVYRDVGATLQKSILSAAVVVVSVQTGVIAASIYNERGFAAYQVAFLDALRNFPFENDDLVLAPSDYGEDVGTWAPLVMKNEMLFSRAAFFTSALAPATLQQHRDRFALYAFLRGKTAWNLMDLRRLGLLGPRGEALADQSLFDREQQAVAAGRANYQSIVARAKRVIVFEPSGPRLFPRQRLAAYLTPVDEQSRNGVRVGIYRPLAAPK